MKNLTFAFFTAILFFASCKGGNNKNKDNVNEPNKVGNTKQCFVYALNKDSATLNLSINGTEVSGILNYNLFEKDKNSGTIAGIIKGDTIIADYKFQSEGTTSIRQIAWLKDGDKLTEGYGESEEIDGKTTFKNLQNLKFGNGIVFSKINCK